MDAEKAIRQLEFDIDMIKFDPSTGETYTEEQVRMHNKENYDTLQADKAGIEALGYRVERDAINNQDAFGDTKICCPTCKQAAIINPFRKDPELYPHCPWCGQKLKGDKPWQSERK